MPLGIVVERRASIHAWADDIWMPVTVVAGAPMGADWSLMVSGTGWDRYLAATLLLELHHKETDDYIFNLMSKTPTLYVVLRQTGEEDKKDENGKTIPVRAHLVTASPNEAEAHLESDEEIVEKVTMPPDVLIWVEAFIDRHHIDEPFIKRRKTKIKVEDHLFGKEPIFSTRRTGPSGSKP
ncbi:hypothetical protein MNBD_ALPHA09-1474 [hydrothermal vent metagenome]|uniref:Molybdopterin-guanine dinucleotide biosynthesis protein MobA n=1 Tax=hydrothermal vent metagenome TaxID=652676 RepID=A0A3B0T0M1_9ZZZZ